MAELTAIPGVPQQIRLIARLRWMLFKNSLRNVKGRLEAVSSGILWLMMTGVVVGGGIFFGIATFYLVAHGRWTWLAGLMWIIFLFWQIYPIFAASVGAQFDFSNLLRFPLRFGSFFSVSVIYGLFDPGAVASMVWLFCALIGLGIAQPPAIGWALLVLIAFAAMNLFFARMLFVWIEKWLARRRTREILGFIFILIIIGFQFIGPAIEHFQHHHAALQSGWIPALLAASNVLPPGLAGRSLQLGLAASFARAALLLVCLLIYAGAFLWLLRIRLAAQYRGESLSETVATAPISPAARHPVSRSVRPASDLLEIPGIPRPIAAVFEKEVRYALRSGPMMLNLIVPVIIVLIFGFAGRQPHKSDDLFAHASRTGFIFPIAIAYTLLIQINWVFNCFAFEGTGIQFFLLAPVRFRDIVMGKNLFLSVISVIQALLVWAVVSWVFSPPSSLIVLATFAALLYGSLANFAIGNVLSVCFPRRLEFGAFRQKKQAGVTMLVAFAAQAVLVGLGALVFAGTYFFHRTALAIPIFLVFAIIAAIGYRITLGRVDRLAMSHRETLTTELCRQE